MGKPSKIPFEAKARLKEYHQGESLVKKPKLPLTNAYFTLGLCHADRTPDKNARLV